MINHFNCFDKKYTRCFLPNILASDNLWYTLAGAPSLWTMRFTLAKDDQFRYKYIIIARCEF